MKVARLQNSSVLASNAVHHRVDSLTGLVAFLAVGGAHLLQGATWLDPVGGLIVSTMVIRAGWSNTKAAVMELADRAVDQDVSDAVRRAAQNSLISAHATGGSDNEVTVERVEGVKSGQNYLMDVDLVVPQDWSVARTASVENTMRQEIGATVRGVRRVRIRFGSRVDGLSPLLDDFIDPDMVRQGRSVEMDKHQDDHKHSAH